MDTQNTPLGEKYLDQKQAESYLRCSRTKLFRIRKSHQIPHYRHGGVLYFLREDLDAYLSSLKATLTSATR